MVEISVEGTNTLTICGDTHGTPLPLAPLPLPLLPFFSLPLFLSSFPFLRWIELITGQIYDVLEIFRRNGYPSPSHHYLFNGDFVDRGSWSTEVALLLYGFKALYPDCVHLNRGNHETDDMNKVYGFEGECRSKYVPVSLSPSFSKYCIT